jgi:hypothetical protein
MELEDNNAVQPKFYLGQYLDVKDSVNKWANAEVLYVRQDNIYIHYTGWSAKYDEYINKNSERIIQQW